MYNNSEFRPYFSRVEQENTINNPQIYKQGLIEKTSIPSRHFNWYLDEDEEKNI
jgi:hypothetical protein